MMMVFTSAPAAQTLPGPDQLPRADVILYDGECGFCRGSVARIHRLDRRGRIAFLPAQDPRVAVDYPELSQDQLMSELVLIDRSGRSHGGAAAFRYLSRRLPSLWLLAPLMHIPFTLPVWSAIYRFIAKRRYLLGGKRCDNGACKL